MKKILAILLAISIIFCFAACGNNNNTSSEKAKLKILDTEYAIEDYAVCVSKDNGELLDQINNALAEITDGGVADKIVDKYIYGKPHDLKFQENVEGKKELRMATNAQFPPYEYYENGKIIGIDIEMAEFIADKLDRKLVIDDMDFDTIITAVQSGKADMGMAGMTVTEERLRLINFSTTYAKGIQVIIVPEDSKITSIESIRAKDASYLIGTQRGTTGALKAEKDFGAERVMKYDAGSEAVQALLAGKVDCVIIDKEPAKAYVAANNK